MQTFMSAKSLLVCVCICRLCLCLCLLCFNLVRSACIARRVVEPVLVEVRGDSTQEGSERIALTGTKGRQGNRLDGRRLGRQDINTSVALILLDWLRHFGFGFELRLGLCHAQHRDSDCTLMRSIFDSVSRAHSRLTGHTRIRLALRQHCGKDRRATRIVVKEAEAEENFRLSGSAARVEN